MEISVGEGERQFIRRMGRSVGAERYSAVLGSERMKWGYGEKQFILVGWA